MTLSPTLTPPERMAEIRELLRDIEEVRADGERLDAAADALGIGPVDELEKLLCQADEAWCKHGALVALLLEHLDRAEADGSLAECEQMLQVTYGGAEIRKLLRDIEEVRADGERLDAAADALGIGPVDELEKLLCQADEAWCKHGALVALLLEHLDRAEAEGSLAECEQMLRVSYGGGGMMWLPSFNSSRQRAEHRDRLAAAVKVAARLDGLSSSELVPAFLAATLGDVRISGGRYEARAYGFRATSVRNRTQAVRNWILAVTAEAAQAPIGKVA